MSDSYLTITTPLDKGVNRNRKFHLGNLKGEEGLCRDFNYQMEICSYEQLTEDEKEELVGSYVTVRIGLSTKEGLNNQRYINGMVFRLRELGMSKAPLMPEIWRYQIELSSWFRQLEYAHECRIFQKNDNTSLKIVTDLLSELEFKEFENRTKKKYPKRDYVTIYDESYYHFILRLLQTEGILWYFEHDKTKHKLVFCDDISRLPKIPDDSWTGLDNFTTFCRQNSFIQIDGVQTSDVDYDSQPVKKVGKQGDSTFNYFEYPGNFKQRADGEMKTSILNQVVRSEELLFEGTSNIRLLEGGKVLSLEAPVLRDLDKKDYVIKNLKIEATAETYSNAFAVLPISQLFFYLPSERLQKPRIIGNQTAIVTGSKNKANVHTDSQGRVMVRFHWDRYSPAEVGSAFIRSLAPAAGPRRGFVFVPEIGEEVVVAFEDGDPDKPIIVGRVYSSNQKLPVSPNSSPFQSVIQAKNQDGANRVLFEDKSGSECLEYRAKKDMTIKVGGDLSINVDQNLNMSAKNVNIRTNGNFFSGNIISLSAKGINNTVGNKITNATGLAVANITGAVMDTKTGANDVNLALGAVDSSSGGPTISKSPIMLNTTAGDVEFSGKSKMKNKGLIVANTGKEKLENSAGKKVEQDAALAVLTKSKQEKNKIASSTTTKALMINDKAETAINDG
ncbi:MAG: type VI secretion system tip protein VgrG [Proteobacteria bacterium]|nr:type VI secretion system tip protein VgrG [Pseudomonadota bacterium]